MLLLYSFGYKICLNFDFELLSTFRNVYSSLLHIFSIFALTTHDRLTDV